MAKWQFTLDFKPFWKKTSPHIAAGLIAIDIKALLPKIRERKAEIYQDMAAELEDEILPLFEELAEHEEDDDVELFDSAMYALYEWADTSLDNQFGGRKMCWVSTII